MSWTQLQSFQLAPLNSSRYTSILKSVMFNWFNCSKKEILITNRYWLRDQLILVGFLILIIFELFCFLKLCLIFDLKFSSQFNLNKKKIVGCIIFIWKKLYYIGYAKLCSTSYEARTVEVTKFIHYFRQNDPSQHLNSFKISLTFSSIKSGTSLNLELGHLWLLRTRK